VLYPVYAIQHIDLLADALTRGGPAIKHQHTTNEKFILTHQQTSVYAGIIFRHGVTVKLTELITRCQLGQQGRSKETRITSFGGGKRQSPWCVEREAGIQSYALFNSARAALGS
jgi:hypothetical protein